MKKENEIAPPILSICLITYNQKQYIHQAIKGVLMQKTNFAWELIIADDFSTDGTREILLAYKKQHPEKIKLILQKKNIGPALNWKDLITAPKSKYISYFEGDDYWTDPLKLQKQVNFLEANNDYAICFHDALESHTDKKKNHNYCASLKDDTYSLKDLFYSNFIPTCSAVFTNNTSSYPKWLYQLGVGDWPLHLINAQYGKIKYLNHLMGVHRIHDKGVWSLNKQIKNIKVVIQVYKDLERYFKPATQFKKEFKEGKANLIYQLAQEYKKNKNIILGFLYLVQSLAINPTKSVWNIKSYYRFIK